MQSFSVNSLHITHSTKDSFSSLIRVLFSKPLSSNQILKNCQLLITTPEICAKQSCLLVQLETWHLSREWLRGGNPFKFAHKLLYQVCERRTAKLSNLLALLSLSLLEKGLHPSFIYSWFKELHCLANWSIKISSNHASTPKTRQDACDWSLHLFRLWKYEKEIPLE